MRRFAPAHGPKLTSEDPKILLLNEFQWVGMPPSVDIGARVDPAAIACALPISRAWQLIYTVGYGSRFAIRKREDDMPTRPQDRKHAAKRCMVIRERRHDVEARHSVEALGQIRLADISVLDVEMAVEEPTGTPVAGHLVDGCHLEAATYE